MWLWTTPIPAHDTLYTQHPLPYVDILSRRTRNCDQVWGDTVIPQSMQFKWNAVFTRKLHSQLIQIHMSPSTYSNPSLGAWTKTTTHKSTNLPTQRPCCEVRLYAHSSNTMSLDSGASQEAHIAWEATTLEEPTKNRHILRNCARGPVQQWRELYSLLSL